jgi:restriction endonuclease S subunit
MNGGTGLLGRENYPIVPLEDLCDLCSGITKGRKIDSTVTVEVPYMAVANVQDGSLKLDNVKTIEATPEEIHRYQLMPGDLLLTEGGDPDKLGRGAIWNGEISSCIHQNHIFRARKASQHVDMEYLAHLVSSPYGKRYFLRQSKQTTGQLKRFPVPLPPLEEQRRIAAILDVSQKLQRLHRQRIESLYRLRQSMYRKLFSQPCSDLLPLSSLAKITSGYAFKAADFCEQGAHVIRMSDLGGEDVDLASSALVPAEVTEGLERFELFEGDILLGMSGSLGKLGIVPCIPAGARVFLNQRVAKISLLPSSPISRELLVEAIKSKQYIGHLERCAAGVAVRNVSSTQMLDFLIPVLTQEEGRAFSRGCRTVSAQILRSEHCIAQSRELQASLVEALLGQP